MPPPSLPVPGLGVKIALVDRAEGVGLLVVVLFGLVKFPPLLVLFAAVVAGGAVLRCWQW